MAGAPLPRRSEIRSALLDCAGWFGGIAVFSAIVNLLYLTGSLYMLQVYDRVLTSRSVETLIGLSLIVLGAFVFQGLLDSLRSRMLARIGARFDELLAPRVFQLAATSSSRNLRETEASPVRDLDQVRNFLSGMGPTALFDMPFLLIFLAVTFMLHPWLGWLTVFGGVVIVALTFLTEWRSRSPALTLTEMSARRQSLVDTARRNAETTTALGMVPSLMARFRHLSDRHVSATLNASDVISGVGAFAKVFRQILQSASLGLGAYLAIHGEVSAGGIVAASILTSRALAPIETAVANWRGFIVARQSLQRLEKALAANPPAPERQPLPAPQLSLIVEDLVVASPDRTKPILNGISLNLTAGDALGIIGPTGSGKSTLARALVGVCSPVRGAVRIDGATLDQWGQDLGRHVGYLPQDIEMFGGTISDNIARFAAAPDRAAVIAAAKAASAHEMILSLPKGYDMLIGPGGTSLSGGQRQRIALARALYGEPFLIVLDEPNANLDGEGDDALNGAIRGLRERGAIVAVITHRPSGLASANLVAILKEGRIVASGPRDQMLQSMLQPAQSSPMRQTPRTVSK